MIYWCNVALTITNQISSQLLITLPYVSAIRFFSQWLPVTITLIHMIPSVVESNHSTESNKRATILPIGKFASINKFKPSLNVAMLQTKYALNLKH